LNCKKAAQELFVRYAQKMWLLFVRYRNQSKSDLPNLKRLKFGVGGFFINDSFKKS